ncbi:hypothetical protein ABW19_dt0207898 [Dactylella cylindrospora]|nr:hypothetical protein ABW19_dt0207898 [Dactylella cylindrospora]
MTFGSPWSCSVGLPPPPIPMPPSFFSTLPFLLLTTSSAPTSALPGPTLGFLSSCRCPDLLLSSISICAFSFALCASLAHCCFCLSTSFATSPPSQNKSSTLSASPSFFLIPPHFSNIPFLYFTAKLSASSMLLFFPAIFNIGRSVQRGN